MIKSAHYRRAVWFEGNESEFSEVMENCLNNPNAGNHPVFRISDDLECVVVRHHALAGRTFLHFVSYEQGAGAAVIPAVLGANDIDPNEAAPPNGTEFIRSQLYLLVEGNDIIWTTHNSALRENSIANLVREFVREFSDDEQDLGFVLHAILDLNQLERAFSEGIEEIDLGLGGFRSTIDEAFSDDDAIGGGILGHLRAMISHPLSADDLDAASEVETKIVLRPGKSWKKENVKNFLSDLALDVYQNHDDGFAIVTKSGLRLTRDKVTISKQFEVDGNKQVIDSTQVRARMHDIFDRLFQADIFE